MGLFGLNKREVEIIAEEVSAGATRRSVQTVALLFSVLPKATLDKRITRKQVEATGAYFPEGWFDKRGRTTVRNLLKNIDP